MAVRSIIDVEVDSAGNFARFAAKYDAYQKLLKESPAAWAKVTDGIGRTRKEFDQVVKQQVATIARAKLLADAEREALRITTTIGDRWRELARNTKSTAANIKDATTSLLKWTALTGVVSGLLGAGGLFGINRLAASVSAGRQSSMGLGASYGQAKSFGVNFGRLVDPGSFLGSIADARGDVTKRVGFYGAGLGEHQLGGSTADVGVEVLRGLKKLADNTDPKLYAQLVQSRQLGLVGGSSELLRLLRATSGAEFEQLAGGYRKNVGGLDLSSDTQKKWQDFYTQIGRAGEQIENTFVKGLLPLVPGLDKLSAGVEKTIRTFLASDAVKKWMDEAGKGLEMLAEHVGKPEFEQNVRALVTGIGAIASAMGRFIAWFGGSSLQTPDKTSVNRGNEVPTDPGQRKFNAWANYVTGGANTSPIGTEAYIRDAAKRRGINPDVAVAVARSEGLSNYVGDKGTSFGPFQLHYKNNIPGLSNGGLGDEFTKATGLHARDPNTVKQQIDFALDQALRGGWGPWHGWKGDPRAGLPSGGATVRIENNTGGNAIVTTNQLGGQQ